MASKTSKESADKLFKTLGLDVVDGKIIHIEKPPEPEYIPPERPPPEPKQRGVKEGTKRGSYQTKKKAIKNPLKTTYICKQCGRKNTYIRKGKRLREFCNDGCRQKYGRGERKLKEISERKKRLIDGLN